MKYCIDLDSCDAIIVSVILMIIKLLKSPWSFGEKKVFFQVNVSTVAMLCFKIDE